MPWELIYTSAPRGMASGQSGFCTVARTADLREAVAQRLEQISSYHYLEFTGASLSPRNPTISAYRVLDIRGTKFHALTRVLPCGLDFTARSNHLAHHLIFGVDELASLPSPAAILRHWDGWQTAWQGEPRLLQRISVESFNQLPPASWPAKAWLEVTGDAGRAAGLLDGEFGRSCYLVTPSGGEHSLLELFCESLQLLNPNGRSPARAWQHSFTTFLQGEDAATDFHWRGCQEGTPAYAQAVRRSAVFTPLNTIRVPNNPLTRLAREGPKLPTPTFTALSVPAAVPVPRTPLTIRKNPAGNQFKPRGRPDSGNGVSKQGARNKGSGGRIITINRAWLTIGIAGILLASLLTVKFFWLDRIQSSLNSPLPSRAFQTNANNPNQAAHEKPVIKPPTPEVLAQPIVPPQPAEAPFDLVKASKELDRVLPDIPTYLVVVQKLEDDIPVEGVDPLTKLLQKFSRDIFPRDLDLHYNVNVWGSPVMLTVKVDSLTNTHNLRLQATEESQSNTEFVFNHSGKLDTKFDPDKPPFAFSIFFQPAATNITNQSTAFEPFRLLVINQNRQPPWLELDRQFLQLNAGRQMARFIEPLRKRLELFQTGSFSWQLRPYVKVTNASGATESKDLYELLPSDVQPELENELDFTEINQFLKKKLDAQRGESARLQKEIENQNASTQPSVDFGLPVGKVLGLTNIDLSSFNAFVVARQPPKPTSKLFLNYVKRIAEKARLQLPWLENRSETPSGSPPQKLREFCDVLMTNLPAQYTELNLGSRESNYFVLAWLSLRQGEDIEKLAQEKATSDYSVNQLRHDFEFVPDSLERLSYARLILTGPHVQLEVIRFTSPKKAELP